MSSIPPLTCYGSGKTVEVSREEAANNALKPLLQLQGMAWVHLFYFNSSDFFWLCKLVASKLGRHLKFQVRQLKGRI